MLRLAPAGAGFLVAVLLACNTPPAPKPTKISDPQAQPGVPTPSLPTASPFNNPDKEPPPPRSQPQLPPDELAATLAKAEKERQIGDVAEASHTLHHCANKVPQSVRCEGELAALVAAMPHHKYEGEYYLKEAIAGDEPGLDPAYYRRLGEALQRKGMYEDAATAYTRMIERSEPAATAADHYTLAVVLQGIPSRLADATAELHRAYELDPSQHAWLRDEAILLSQQPDRLAEAIARFEEFRTKTSEPSVIADTDRRLTELRAATAPAPTPPAPAAKKKKKPTG